MFYIATEDQRRLELNTDFEAEWVRSGTFNVSIAFENQQTITNSSTAFFFIGPNPAKDRLQIHLMKIIAN